MSPDRQHVYIDFAPPGSAVAVGAWPLRRGQGFDPLAPRARPRGRPRGALAVRPAAPADPRARDEWGRVAGASGRPLARLFVNETGMSFSRWRTELRLAASLPLLADGVAVSVVARRV